MPLKSVDAKTLKHWLDSGEAVLVDVREPAEHEAERIAGAALVPLSRLSASEMPCCEGKKLVLHCRAGMRGANACAALLANTPDRELYNLEGGISAWAAAGYDVLRSGRRVLPLDRQVQLTIGVLLVTASVLGAVFSPAWFILTGMIGAGLTFAGLSGFCGLAMLLARMPWNRKRS